MIRFLTIRCLLAALAFTLPLTLWALPSSFDLNSPALSFTKNLGQFTDMDGNPVPGLYYRASVPGLDVYVTDQGFSYVFWKKAGSSEEEEEGAHEMSPLEYAREDMELVGADIDPAKIRAEEPLNQGVTNYYFAHCPEGILGVNSYRKLIVESVYPGIDWVIYFEGKKGLKYDFIVHPGADPAQIRLRYQGAGELSLNANKLHLETSLGSFTEGRPVARMESGRKVGAAFALNQNEVTFDLEPYDPSQILIIDPPLVWSSYIGGSSLDGPDAVNADTDGNVYIAGYCQSSNYPVINPGGGAFYQGTKSSGADMMITKFDSNGVRIWSTFYGGTGSEGFQAGIAFDAANRVYVGGYTNSTNLPVQNRAGAYNQATNPGSNSMFLLRFTATGTREWGTYVGGSGADYLYALEVDGSGNIYLGGYSNSTNFPTVNPGGGAWFQGSNAGNYDAVITRFDPSGTMTWSSYYGGITAEGGVFKGFGMALDATGNLFVTGETQSFGFPVLNPGGGAYYQSLKNGTMDAFILKFGPAGNRVWATHFGGTANESGTGLTVDGSGNLYVVGYSTSSSIGAGGPGGGEYLQTTNGGGEDLFILKFNNTGTAIWFTYYGGNGNEKGYGGRVVDTDTDGNVYVTGYTYSQNFPVYNPGNGAYYQGSLGGAFDRDLFMLRFTNTGIRDWATYFGGGGADWGNELFVRPSGCVLVTGEWLSSSGITTMDQGGGAWFQSGLAGSHDGFIAEFCPPVQLDENAFPLSASAQSPGNELKWRLPQGQTAQDMTVELSADGKSFAPLATSLAGSTEQFLHLNPAAGLNYYRIRVTDPEGHDSFSRIAAVFSQTSAPWDLLGVQGTTNGTLTLLLQAHQPGDLHLSLTDLRGRQLFQDEFEPETGSVSTRTFQLNSLAPGAYLLKMRGSGHQQVKRFVITE